MATYCSARFESEPFCFINYGGKRPPFTVSHECNVPSDRTGYHVILGVWDISDTANAFYNVVDVTFGGSNDGGGGDVNPPTIPGNLRVTGATSTSISLAWNASTDNTGVSGYDIYAGTTRIGSVSGGTLSFTHSGLTANTSYTYSVRAKDAAGNTSAASSQVTGKTIAGDSGTTCTAPEWKSEDVYNGGNRVVYDGKLYEARWWTQGNRPDPNNTWGVWKFISDCGSNNGGNGGTDTQAPTAPTNLSSTAKTSSSIYRMECFNR
jgi:chitodextrinase